MKSLIIKISLVIVLLLIIVFVVYMVNNKEMPKTYSLGDYGVEITVPREFVKLDPQNSAQILNLQDEKGITISVMELKGDFWTSDDPEAIAKQYIELMSSAKYDSSMKNVSKETLNINGEPLGKVEMTLERNINKKRTMSILTTKAHGYLALEIYGNPQIIEENKDQITSIINTLKFSKNRHNYQKDKEKIQEL